MSLSPAVFFPSSRLQGHAQKWLKSPQVPYDAAVMTTVWPAVSLLTDVGLNLLFAVYRKLGVAVRGPCRIYRNATAVCNLRGYYVWYSRFWWFLIPPCIWPCEAKHKASTQRIPAALLSRQLLFHHSPCRFVVAIATSSAITCCL